MTPIAYYGSFWTQFGVSPDLFTDLTTEEATVKNFLTTVTYSSQSYWKVYL